MNRRRNLPSWREDGWAFEPIRHRLRRIARHVLPAALYGFAFGILVVLAGIGLGALVLELLRRGDV